MTIRCLARHPAVQVPRGVCYGQSDVALTTGWEVFASQLADCIRKAGIRMLVASPLMRCRMPAEWVAAHTQCELLLEPRLKEISFGDWEMRPWDDVPPSALDEWALDLLGFSSPQGESGQELISRVTAVWSEFNAGPSCAVLSHGGPLRILDALVSGKNIDLAVEAVPLGSIKMVSEKIFEE